MYLSHFYIPVNTPLGGVGAATQTFAPGGKYPRAATECVGLLHRVISKLLIKLELQYLKIQDDRSTGNMFTKCEAILRSVAY